MEPTVGRDSAPDKTGGNGGPRHRILVVDDHRDSATSLAMVLGLMGYETQVAYDGPGALDAAERFRPHLVFLDIGLPKLDGYDTCRRLRALEWAAGLVIVALTGRGHPEDRLRSTEAGFSHHLIKPMASEDLERVLAGVRAA